MESKILNKNSFFFLIFLTLFLFIFKWIFSYIYFDDDLSIKVIFDTKSDGYFYYVYTEALSSLNFNNSFDTNINNLKNLPLPFYAIFLPSLLFKVFGNFSILIVEFIFIFLFLLIFLTIFRKLNFSFLFSILLTLILFNIPTFIEILSLNSLPYITALNELYNLRFPRPIIVNLFYYIFILYLLSLEKKNVFTYKNFFFLAIILSFSLSSFYYYFIIQLISFFFILLYYFKIKELLDLKIFKYYFFSIGIFICISLPFLYFLLTSEPDYQERLYIINLEIDKKIILLKYLFSKLFSIKSVLLLLFLSVINFLYNKKKLYNFNKINIFFILIIASIISPFFFITLSPKTGLVYHFINLIVLNIFLYIFVLISSYFFKKFLTLEKNYLYYFFIFIFLFFYNFNIYKNFNNKYSDEDYKLQRIGISKATKVIKNENIDKINILTFDSRLMVWSIFNGVNQIKPLSGQLVPKKHEMIENDLIEAFKFLNLNNTSFIKFLENRLAGWRLFNPNTQLFFWGRYSASKLKTYNNSKNFKPNELELINKTSPLNVQSIAIPLEEFYRLDNKFKNFRTQNKFMPNLIVINSNNINLKNSRIENYCKIFSNKMIEIYLDKEICEEKY